VASAGRPRRSRGLKKKDEKKNWINRRETGLGKRTLVFLRMHGIFTNSRNKARGRKKERNE
jgi:hypothetical protein